jgi:hypothetical protein
VSLGLIPIFQPEGAAKFSALGEALADNLDALEELARDKGLVPLSAFADQREVPDGFDGSPDELDDLLGPSDDWFDPLNGANAITKLASYLRTKRPTAIRNRKAVLKELTALADCLTKAAKRKVRFRLTFA